MNNQAKNGDGLRVMQCLVRSAWSVGHLLRSTLLTVLVSSMTAFFFNTYVIHSQSSQPQQLINKDALTGTLTSKADARLYQIHIEAKEFVLIRAFQKEMDIDLALLDATGRVLANMDMEVDTDRAEYLGWIAADAGDFTVRLTPGRENETYGRYEVQVLERRLPTDEDQNRMKAQAVVMEAQASLQEIKTQPREAGRLIRGAIAKYQQSIPMWQAAKDKNAMARCLIIVGENSLRLGDRPAARDSFEKALVLRRASPVDRWGEAEALNNLAVVHDETGEKQEAIELHKLVRPIRRETGNLKGEITTLLNVSKSYVELDEITLAQAALEETRVVLDEFKKKTNGVGDQQGESEYSSRYGLIYDRLGASELAISWFERALAIIRSIPDYSHNPLYVESEATYLNNLGKAYSGKGDKNKARDYYQQALKRCGDDCPSNKRADFLHNLASASIALGDLQTARSSFDDVLKFRGNDSFYEAYTRIGLGNLNLNYETKDLPAARKEFDRALVLSQRVGARQLVVAALEGRARVELASGKEVEAEKDIEQGLAEINQLAARIINPDQRASYLAATQRLYDHKLRLLMRKHDRQPSAGFAEAAFALSESARARGLLDLLQEGRVDIGRDIDRNLVQRQRAAAELLTNKFDYIMSLKVRRERLHALGAPAELVNKLEREISDEEQEAAVANREFESVQDQIRNANHRYRELVSPKTIGVKEVQEQILDRDDTMLLEFRLADEHSYLFAITRNSFEVHSLPDRNTIEKAARELYSSLVARGEKREFEPREERRRRIREADEKFKTNVPLVSDMLLGKVQELSRKKRLLIVADGFLQYLPFAALVQPHSSLRLRPAFLIRTQEIVSVPSVSALRLIQTTEKPILPSKELVVIGDPIYRSKLRSGRNLSAAGRQSSSRNMLPLEERIIGDEFEPLKYAGQEANAILNLVPKSARDDFLRERATKQVATSDALIGYRLIHYVAHGRFDSERPSRSALIFSLFNRAGTPVKGGGTMTIAEVYNMKLNADLVTLSGCETALGWDIRGEGMIGLPRGFMYAGSKRVLSSLWVVNDEATTILMSRFYNRMLQKNKPVKKNKPVTTSEALRSAQESMAQLPPYYWAGFVLYGQW